MYGLKAAYTPTARAFAWVNTGFGGWERSVCPECGRQTAVPRPCGEDCFMTAGKRSYPDFMSFTGAGTILLVSARAAEAMLADGITGIGAAVPVSVRRGDETKSEPVPAAYCRLDVTGSVDFDLKAMSLRRRHVCPACGGFEWSRQRLSLIDTVLDYTRWDGSDLCRVSSFPGHVVCTDRVKRLIEENRFTGAVLCAEKDIFRI